MKSVAIRPLTFFVLTALSAISLRRSAESFFARAFPPFNPPSLPSATAAAFFFTFATPN